MINTGEFLDSLDTPDPEAAVELSDCVNELLSEYSARERSFYLLLHAIKYYYRIDEPEYELVDYQLAAEEIALMEEDSDAE